MRIVCSLLILIPFLLRVTVAEPLEIADFFSPSNTCDYLLFSPAFLQQGAEAMAQYRNAFQGDDVTAAKFIVLEHLFEQSLFAGHAPDSIILRSIHFARSSWAVPPAYIVFLGDDSVLCDEESLIPGNRGPMPTHIFDCTITSSADVSGDIKLDTSFAFSDDWYLKSCVDSVKKPVWDECGSCFESPPALGRIPAETLDDLMNYLHKVIRYESDTDAAPWKNRVLMVADDRTDKNRRDYLDHAAQLYSIGEPLTGRFQEKLFLEDYTMQGQNAFATAKGRFFELINRGAALSIFFAHGSSAQLTGEKMLVADDYPRFSNQNKPTIFISIACDNGAFYMPLQRSMCKRYLFSADGGAIAYIANPNVTIYPYSMPFLMKTLSNFKEYPSMSIGNVVALAKKDECFGAGKSFEVFGDPALNRGLTEVPLSLELTGDNTIFCSVESDVLQQGEVYWELSVTDTTCNDTTWTALEFRDTVVASGTDLLQNGYCLLEPDQSGIQKITRLTVYAWNGSVTGCGAISLWPEMPVAALAAPVEKSRIPPLMKIVNTDGRFVRLVFPAMKRSGRQVGVFSLRGGKITSLSVPRNAGFVLFDKESAASGTYIARFCKQTHSAGVLFSIP